MSRRAAQRSKTPEELSLPRSVAHPGILLLNRASLHALQRSPSDEEAVRYVLDMMGMRSMRAQGLSKPITSFSNMLTGDFRLYLTIGGGGVVRGLLKVGTKQLFVRRKPDAEYSQVSPLCVLDFYVHEGCQRSGVGSALFEHMLRHERAAAAALGYDRPSPKLIGFLAKHYQLKHYTPQSNNFVLFEQFWAPRPRDKPPAPPAQSAPPSRSVARLRQQVAESSLAAPSAEAAADDGLQFGGGAAKAADERRLEQENADPNQQQQMYAWQWQQQPPTRLQPQMPPLYQPHAPQRAQQSQLQHLLQQSQPPAPPQQHQPPPHQPPHQPQHQPPPPPARTWAAVPPPPPSQHMQPPSWQQPALAQHGRGGVLLQGTGWEPPQQRMQASYPLPSLGGAPGAGSHPWALAPAAAAAPTGGAGRNPREAYLAEQRTRMMRRPF